VEDSNSRHSTPAEARTPTRRLQAKPTPVKPVDAVSEAERYIYGKGVGQDCDRGMRLLKTAAEQSNAKAMISMGALFSTGTCTPRDLPTAYRWFALALHKEPDNLALQEDLQKLWSQMTQPERQLAIKLSQ
jgi:TPR repeat protein